MYAKTTKTQAKATSCAEKKSQLVRIYSPAAEGGAGGGGVVNMPRHRIWGHLHATQNQN